MDASPSFAVIILVSVVSSSIAAVLSGLVIWWRKSAVDEAKATARDEELTRELKHFRTETERMLGKMDQVMNGFGTRLETANERQGKLWYAMFGPTEQNGVHGSVKELLRDFAKMVERLSWVESTAKELAGDVGQHSQQIQGLRRGDGGTGRTG